MLNKLSIVLFIASLSLIQSQTISNDTSYPDLVVNTSSGPVRGVTYVKQGLLGEYRVMNGWMGIPFAQKPIGDLRFKRPLPVKNWNETLITDHLPNSCIQIRNENPIFGDTGNILTTPTSEDCLYLNIWSPYPNSNQPLPVMIWIHGGAFVVGSTTSDLYQPVTLVPESNVILVSIQYRLSIFGFMYLNSPDAPGNQGMLDQVLALQWVKQNIALFGGDPNQITLFGESAGAASVNHHLLSPLSQDLFNNAIMESGSSLSEWAVLNSRDTRLAALGYDKILVSLGCRNARLADRIKCAVNLDANNLLIGANLYANGLPFAPVVDSYFMPDDAMTLMTQGRFKKCPILLGTNKNEGNLFLAQDYPDIYLANLTARPNMTYSNFQALLKRSLPKFPKLGSRSAFDAILYRYSNWPNLENQLANLFNLNNIGGDYLFVCPSTTLADFYATHNQSVFMYFFQHQSSQSLLPRWFGAIHTEEIQFVFGKPIRSDSKYEADEQMLSRRMMRYWSNFARFGDPNGPSDSQVYESACKKFGLASVECVREKYMIINSKQLDQWPKYEIKDTETDDRQRAYMNLVTSKLSVSYGLRAEYCGFWESYINKIIG